MPLGRKGNAPAGGYTIPSPPSAAFSSEVALSSTVTHLTPRIEPFPTALQAFNASELPRCLAILERHETPAAAALRARCLLRLERPVEVTAYLQSISFEALAHDEAGELLGLASRAYAGAGDFDRAQAYLTAARVRAMSAALPALECELAYIAAQQAWLSGRFDETLRRLDDAMRVENDIPSWLQRSTYAYPFTLGYWRARSLELRSSTAALQEKFGEQATLLQAALEEYDGAECSDVYAEASMLFNLSVLARDLDLFELSENVRARAKSLTWTGQAVSFKFHIFQSLGWCNALRGDHLGALRDFRVAAEGAPSLPLRIGAILDRAFLARELGEHLSSAEELEYALHLNEQMDWERCAGEERLTLLALAQQLAPVDAPHARRMLDCYSNLRSPLSSALFGRRDRRVRADECFATAAVLRAEGERERAATLLIEAFEIWFEIKYDWHAACAAAELAELSGHLGFFAAAERGARKRPNSWLARRVEALVLPAARG